MVINTNVQATRTHGVYNRNTSAMNEAMTRVATAQKINSAKDGASVYAISERMRSQIRANDQANQNTQNDSALLKTAQGGIGNTISILNTLKERAINAANDSNLNLNRSDIATEVEQLALQIDDNANKVKFNGRNLLNGAVDNTVGKLNGVSGVNDGATVSANPTARSTSAIYTINNLVTHNGTSITAATNSTTLVGLVKANATDAGDTLFTAGDKITFSWKEDGNLVSKDLTVQSNTALSALSDLGSSNLKIAWANANADLSAAGPTAANLAMNTAFEKASATAGAGIYLVGEQHVAITDFSVTVTHTDAYGQTTNRTEAQELLSATGIQNAYTNKTGSNSVWSTNLQLGETAQGLKSGDDSTKLANLAKRGGSNGSAWSAAPSTVDITINGIKVSVAGSTTIEGLNAIFKDSGMNVEAHLLSKGDEVSFSGGNVTNGTGANAATLKAEEAGLFFVGGDGFDITSVAIAGTGSGGSAVTFENTADLSRFQSRDDGSSNSSGSSAALTFFVGGEPNFGIDVSINKMTTEALLGTTAETFASKFLTKEGAQTAISVIDNALNRALNEQTKLGAMEARLGYTSDNLSTMNENLESTDSVMRDADLAKEMTNYMKYSVLSQAAQYMLAQSGQNAFSVLNLLQQ